MDAHWGNRWYKEVIELYIGYISINGRVLANTIVENALNGDAGEDCSKWILAANALYDIHKDTRLPNVVKLSGEKLQNIFVRESSPKVLAEAGEILGWLGDTRNLEEFVLIPGGEYDLEELGDKIPIKQFEISKYPVTNAWYKKFIEAGGYNTGEYWSEHGKLWLQETKTNLPGYWNDRKWTCPNAPVVSVSWYEADAFCRWLSMNNKEYSYSLPTEQQWQAAAAGKEKRKYPWKGAWNKDFCNNEAAGIGKTSSVGIFLKGATTDGVYDMAGNVWEWTRTQYKSKKDLDTFKKGERWEDGPFLRGGSWYFVAALCRCAYRFYYFPAFRYRNGGFRCARITL